MSNVSQLVMPSLSSLTITYQDDFSNLAQLKTSAFFHEIDILVNKMMVHETELSQWFDVLGAEKRDVLKSSVLDTNFAQFASDSEEYQTAIEVTVIKNKLRHAIIRHFLTLSNQNLGLKPFETTVILHYCDVAEIVDIIFHKWRENLYHSELGKKVLAMETAHEGSGALHIKKLGLDNQYALYKKEEGNWKQVPLSQFLPEEYQALDNVLSSLIASLHQYQTEKEVPALISYFESLKRAFACTDLGELDSVWEAVDVAWMSVGGRMQPVHAMEYNYIDPARMRVMPEVRILLEDIHYEHVNEEAKRTQDNLILDLGKKYSNTRTWIHSEQSMRSSKIGIFVPAIYSGACLVFKFAGQSAPCREKIRIRCGSKISLNMESKKERFLKERECVKKVFGNETFTKLFEPLRVENTVAYCIAAHEVAHAAFVDEQTDANIGFGVISLIEEAKSTWSLYATLRQRIARGSLDSSMLTTMALLLLQSNLRYLTIRGENTFKPYYTAALMEYSAMFESGLLYRNGFGYHIDLSKLDAFYTNMENLFDIMVDIYDHYNGTRAKQLLTERAIETEQILELYEIIKKAT